MDQVFLTSMNGSKATTSFSKTTYSKTPFSQTHSAMIATPEKANKKRPLVHFSL